MRTRLPQSSYRGARAHYPARSRRLRPSASSTRRPAAHRVRFATGLHTAGIYPRRLAAVLPLLDWVGFDVKAPFEEYASIVGSDGGKAALASLERLLVSGVPHQVRCTVPPELDDRAIERLRADLRRLGVGNLELQRCRPSAAVA